MPQDAEKKPAQRRIWILTDGKRGDEVQCAAIADGLAGLVEKKIVAPRPPWEWAAPWGPVDPRDAPGRPHSPFAPPFPDVVIASGRRAVPYARAVRKAGGAFTVILKDPRIALHNADFVWAPAHDRLCGDNVYSTLTSPHGLGDEIARRRGNPSPPVAGMPRPMLGVVLGGPNGGARFDAGAAADLAAKIQTAGNYYASLAVVPSRRTPAAVLDALASKLRGERVFIWRGEGPNPYVDILANADALIVTADSHNMMSEALASGTGVYAYRPPGLAKKFNWFVNELERKGFVRPFAGAADAFSYAPIDATGDIVAAIKKRLPPG